MSLVRHSQPAANRLRLLIVDLAKHCRRYLAGDKLLAISIFMREVS